MRYGGIIFDLDGVICSTDEYHFAAWKAVADGEGIPFDGERNARLRGVSRMESLDIILEEAERVYTSEEKKALADKKNELYRGMLGAMTEKSVSAEVLGTLNALKSAGVRLAIGSSSRNTGYILHKIGLDDFFDAVCDGNGGRRSKPFPDIFLAAAEGLHLPPSDCLVVEDASSGVKAAEAGGFAVATVGYAAETGEGDYVLGNFGELLAVEEIAEEVSRKMPFPPTSR